MAFRHAERSCNLQVGVAGWEGADISHEPDIILVFGDSDRGVTPMLRTSIAIACTGFVIAVSAQAQDFPSKTVTLMMSPMPKRISAGGRLSVKLADSLGSF